MSRDRRRTRDARECCCEVTFDYTASFQYKSFHVDAYLIGISKHGDFAGVPGQNLYKSWKEVYNFATTPHSSPYNTRSYITASGTGHTTNSTTMIPHSSLSEDLTLSMSKPNLDFLLKSEKDDVGAIPDTPALTESAAVVMSWTDTVDVAGEEWLSPRDNNEQDFNITLQKISTYTAGKNYAFNPIADEFRPQSPASWQYTYPHATTGLGNEFYLTVYRAYNHDVTVTETFETIWSDSELDNELAANVTALDDASFDSESGLQTSGFTVFVGGSPLHDDSGFSPYTGGVLFFARVAKFRLSVPNEHRGNWCAMEYEIIKTVGGVDTVESTESIEWITSVSFEDRDSGDYFTDWVAIELPLLRNETRKVKPTRCKFTHRGKWIDLD